jgi:hypothetical protein
MEEINEIKTNTSNILRNVIPGEEVAREKQGFMAYNNK